MTKDRAMELIKKGELSVLIVDVLDIPKLEKATGLTCPEDGIVLRDNYDGVPAFYSDGVFYAKNTIDSDVFLELED